MLKRTAGELAGAIFMGVLFGLVAYVMAAHSSFQWGWTALVGGVFFLLAYFNP